MVVYDTPGAYEVSLTVSNGAGSSTVTKTKMIHVKSIYNNNVSQWVESFEGPGLDAPELSVLSNDNVAFELNNQAASNGTQSLYLNNHSLSYSGELDEFISPNITTQFTSGLSLSFDYAFAAKNTANTDRLTVAISLDCGKTWFNRRILQGTLLRTAPLTSTPFTPTSSQWKSATIPLSQFAQDAPVLLKFTFLSGGGSNMYIDNINVSSTNIGLEETVLENSLSVYPNPSKGHINIELNTQLKNVELGIFDLYGKEVYRGTLKNSHTSLDNLNLGSGVYLLNFTSGKEQHSEKLIIE